MHRPPETTLNGDAGALRFDRALVELRRGRALEIAGGEAVLVVAAVEAVDEFFLARFMAEAGGRVHLVLTAERARAARFSALGNTAPVALSVPAGADMETLRLAAGITRVDTPAADGDVVSLDTERNGGANGAGAGARPAGAAGGNGVAGNGGAGNGRVLTLDNVYPPSFAPTQLTHATLGSAALQLTKAARLVPALLAFEAKREPRPGVLTIAAHEVALHAHSGQPRLQLVSKARVPLADAVDCEIAVFRDEHNLAEHVAILIGTPDTNAAVPVRLHSACLTGDLLGSLRCDCGEQLRTAVARIAALGGGALLYLAQEGRGIGLPNKLRAYVLQDAGLDTVDADQHLGFLADERRYDVAAALLAELGIHRVELMTNNPQKILALREHGIEIVGRLPLVGSSNLHNERYLRAKLERAGHLSEDGADGAR